MQKITPHLWFEHNAEEAARFYVSLFSNSRIVSVIRLDDAPGPKEGAYVVEFVLSGQRFLALNGGPVKGFKFSPATSFLVQCKTQKEIDFLWGKLTKGGKPNVCGWLDDRYGMTWQIAPEILPKMLSDKDPEKVRRVAKAFMRMKKLDIAGLKAAYNGK